MICSRKVIPLLFVPGIKQEYFHINRYPKVLRDVYFAPLVLHLCKTSLEYVQWPALRTLDMIWCTTFNSCEFSWIYWIVYTCCDWASYHPFGFTIFNRKPRCFTVKKQSFLNQPHVVPCFKAASFTHPQWPCDAKESLFILGMQVTIVQAIRSDWKSNVNVVNFGNYT